MTRSALTLLVLPLLLAAPALSAPPKAVLPPRAAAVELVEVSDFECPYCSRVQPTLESLRKRYGKALSFRFVHQPLPFHTRAEPAARAAEAARRQNRFEPMKRLLYERQKALSDDDLMAYAKELKLNVKMFAKDFADPTIAALVQRDIQIANALGATGTPTFFINGVKVRGAQSFEIFQDAIDAELAARPTPKTAGPKWIQERTLANNPDLHGFLYGGVEPTPTPAATAAEDMTVYAVKVDPAGDAILGPLHAPVTAVVFTGYQCPFCKKLEPTLAALQSHYGDKLRIVIKHNPLSHHANGELFAAAAICARAFSPNAFADMHQALMGIDEPISANVDTVTQLAATIGLDVTAFQACLDAPATAQELAADMDLAGDVGAGGTPITFINGVKVMGAKSIEAFARVIDTALIETQKHLGANVPLEALYDRIIANGKVFETLDSRVNMFSPSALPVLGDPSAPIRLTLFVSFGSEFSQRLVRQIDDLVRAGKGRVAIELRHFPFGWHEHGDAFALASICARDQGRAWEFTRSLFDNIGQDDPLVAAARSSAVDLDPLHRCIASETTQARLDRDLADARVASVRSTPAVFINGRKWSPANGYSAKQLEKDLDRYFPVSGPKPTPTPLP
jgi:protein-disulfide isomerase